MIINNELLCPTCGGDIKHYDTVGRFIKTKGGARQKIKMKRFRCVKCNKIHRKAPESVLPYKQYDAEVIKGVLDGLITTDTIGFEDYPCEATMTRWSREIHLSL